MMASVEVARRVLTSGSTALERETLQDRRRRSDAVDRGRCGACHGNCRLVSGRRAVRVATSKIVG